MGTSISVDPLSSVENTPRSIFRRSIPTESVVRVHGYPTLVRSGHVCDGNCHLRPVMRHGNGIPDYFSPLIVALVGIGSIDCDFVGILHSSGGYRSHLKLSAGAQRNH